MGEEHEASPLLDFRFHVSAGDDQLRRPHRAFGVQSTPIAEEFGISKVELGYLFSSFLWLYVVCLVPMGMIVDRLGTRTSTRRASALVDRDRLTGLATGFGMLIATRVVMGVGESTTYPAAGRLIREWIPLKERALFTAFFNGGAYFGPGGRRPRSRWPRRRGRLAHDIPDLCRARLRLAARLADLVPQAGRGELAQLTRNARSLCASATAAARKRSRRRIRSVCAA